MLTEIPSFTVIAEGSRSQGPISFCSQCIILGIIEGDIYQQSQESLAIGKTGWVRGNISSQGPILVSGRVEGNLFCLDKITVSQTAHITGVVICPKLEIKPGAIIDSDILMHWAPPQKSINPIAA